MSAFEDIESSFGGYADMMESIKEPGRMGWAIIEILKILINGGLVEAGQKAVTHSFVASALKPYQIAGTRDAIMEALADGMHAKMREQSDEERDVYLEELEKNGEGS